MKKNTLYTILLVLFIGAAGFIVMKYKRDEEKNVSTTYQLQERKGALAQSPGWEITKQNVARLQNAIKANPNDTKSLVALANLFILEGRTTGNYSYYDMAAMKYVNDVLKKDPANFDALTLKSLLYLSQHHFADGLATAEQARNINPYNAFVYGVLIDGNVEMGNYDSALANAEKMISIRPDMRSYSRISYLREIFGDYPGAIEAMKLAVEAGVPADEATEWSRVQLGHLYENSGDLKNAALMYETSLAAKPDYAYALAGEARMAMAAKDYNKAISLYNQADALVNDYSFKEELAEIYNLTGQKDKSAAISKTVIDEMLKSAEKGKTDENIGHYADRELAYAYLKINDNDKALEHALAEYNRRPKNIDVNETVSWVYYKKGDYAKALPYIVAALKTNSKNPALLCHTGLVYLKNNDKGNAKKYLGEGLKNNPNISESLMEESLHSMKEL